MTGMTTRMKERIGGTPRLIEASSIEGSICWRSDEVVLIE